MSRFQDNVSILIIAEQCIVYWGSSQSDLRVMFLMFHVFLLDDYDPV